MDSRNEATMPVARPKSRKSISHLPQDHSIDKENLTMDIGTIGGGEKRNEPGGRASKKLRSKSMGPGGLDALKDTTGNRRQSIAAPPPKSILKPTMPPLREIPAHIGSRKQSPAKSPKALPRDLHTASISSPVVDRSNALPNPFALEETEAVAETRVLLRTEEEQQTAAREREQRENKETEIDIIARRDARRKSLANRRVSFAPEATLHTWDVVEYMQDSTTSSESTNSTRRASSASTGTIGSPNPETLNPPSPGPSEPPSTPPEQLEEIVAASPADLRRLHQKKRRRISGIPPLNFNNPDDEEFSSSPSEESSIVGDVDQAFDNDNLSEAGSESDEGTAMSIDMGDATETSVASAKSASSSGSSARLEEALQLAARQAGTQGIEFDENGGFDDAEEEDEVLASFSPWAKNSNVQILVSSKDQENLNPYSHAFRTGLEQAAEEEDQDEVTMDMTYAAGRILPSRTSDDEMTMEMTRPLGRIMRSEQPEDDVTMEMTTVVGGILPDMNDRGAKDRRKSVKSSRRSSLRRRSSGEASSLGDETMDFTIAIGGIQQDETLNSPPNEEDITMEFTSVVGGAMEHGNSSFNKRRQSPSRSGFSNHATRESLGTMMEDEAMDMTVAVGRIVSTATDKFTDEENVAMTGSVKTALDTLLPKELSTGSRPEAKRLMEEEADHADLMSSPFQTDVAPKVHTHLATVPMASETGSPSMAAFKGKGLRRSTGLRTSTTPKSGVEIPNMSSPARKPTTPSKQLTPKPSKPRTPAKTPPSKSIVMRTASPRKLFKTEIEAAGSTPKVTPSKIASSPNKLFQRDSSTGVATPTVVLNPNRRRSSGVGIDRIGLGSPRVAAILDRRQSIGDNATAFKPGQLGSVSQAVQFEDPEIIEFEIDQAREDERNREDGRKIMEREADISREDKDATINLKEMIESLTPKKRPLKGRKSLHVGAAKGILGKRPVELDEDDEDDEEQAGVKRLKNHLGSPVKNVKLKAPPTKAETTGRLTRATRRSLETVSGNLLTPTSTQKPETVKTPRSQGRFKDVHDQPSIHHGIDYAFTNSADDTAEAATEIEDDRMQLQEFLNLTSIRFMELTTTKRRHTVAPEGLLTRGDPDQRLQSNQDNGVLENCVVAGACTVPMLELFQHSCHELKKYISEGRAMVREIETETFEENPPLFREYLSATPDIRNLMDNQFKNIKTHARLLSKGMWYEWRMKLLDGLKEGLCKIHEGMRDDDELLQCQQDLLNMILPSLLEKHDQVSAEEAQLRTTAEDLANCDQEELSEARQKLVSADMDIETKKHMIHDLRIQLQENERAFNEGSERKQACLNDIREAEKIRSECRGWTGNEIASLKAKVDSIEEQYGWTVTGVSGTVTSLSFRGDLELVFDASSFKSNDSKDVPVQDAPSRLDLWYIAGNRERSPLPLTHEKKFFLESIRDSIRAMPQAQTTIKELLHAVSTSWQEALEIVKDIQSLNLNCVVETKKTSDFSIVVSAMLLLIPLSSKVELQFHISTGSSQTGLEVDISTAATVIYGERFNERKMGEFLMSRVSGQDTAGGRRSWTEAVEELEGRLLARGKK